MAVLVFAESVDGKLKKTSFEAICMAAKLSSDVVVVALGNIIKEEALAGLGKYGASRVLWVNDERFNQVSANLAADVVSVIMEKAGAKILVLATSPFTASVAAVVAVKQSAALATNVVEIPDLSNGFTVKRSIFSGKAFETVQLSGEKKILVFNKNAVEVTVSDQTVAVEKISPTAELKEKGIKITGSEKASGTVSLPEAEIVVSAGRGLKGAENWGMIEELASLLGAATGCSKPVSDVGWRPHHEHVGQTGIKVSPQLYIAVGISGAIQHLAGVNSSKYILVINKDPDAPFFKAADYGVVGDAFEVVPRLIEALKAAS